MVNGCDAIVLVSVQSGQSHIRWPVLIIVVEIVGDIQTRKGVVDVRARESLLFRK
jgi:hypothetical protein